MKGITAEAEEAPIFFRWDESVVDMLVREAYSVTYGARELRRAIQKRIEDPLAEEMIRARDTAIRSIFVTAEEDGLKIDLT